MEIGEISVRLAADGSGLKKGIEDAQRHMRGLDRFFDNSVESIAKSFSRLGSGSGKGSSVGDGLKAALLDLQASLADNLVKSLKNNVISKNGGSNGLGGLLSGGGFADLLSGMIGGRAGGGAVGAGQPVIVGERGPEVFTPYASGWVTPNGAASAAPVTISMTIVTPDAQSFRLSQGQVMADAAMALQRARRYT